MRRLRTVPIGFLTGATLLLAFPRPADASILFTADQRSVGTQYYSYCPGCGPNGEDEIYSDFDGAAPQTPFGAFTYSASAGSSFYASQTSSVSSTILLATGSASSSTGEDGGASSQYWIKFQLDAPSGFSLTGQLVNGTDSGWLSAGLYQATLPVFPQFDALPGDTLDLNHSGVLAPGNYELIVDATMWGYSFGSETYDIAFAFVPVPEPTTALLVAAVLVAAAAARRGRPVA